MWALVKKSSAYLQGKLDSGEGALDLDPLYEELGGIWKLSELEALGSCRRDVRLVQLSFWVDYDEARKEYIDTGCWVDTRTGELSLTCNYRPVKALKYVKQEDSLFGAVQAATVQVYPGEGNPRVRWEQGIVTKTTEDDLRTVRALAAASVTAEGKAAKNFLKNALASPVLYRLIAYDRIAQAGEDLVLTDREGGTILLGDLPGEEKTTERLRLLPCARLLKDQVLTGGFYYDRSARRLLFWPLSIVTENEIVRLLY